MAIIEFQDVDYEQGQKKLFSGLNFTIEQGQRIVIAGKSGGGKSTLLKLAAGLYFPTHGCIKIRNIDVRKASSSELMWIHEQDGYLFQDGALLSNMTLFENIALPLRYHAHCNESDIHLRVSQALEEFSLTDVQHQRPDQISTGLNKLTALARALITEPKIIYLDEPLIGVDQANQKIILRHLQKLKDKNITMLMISHDEQHILPLAEQLWVLHGGKIAIQSDVKKEGK